MHAIYVSALSPAQVYMSSIAHLYIKIELLDEFPQLDPDIVCHNKHNHLSNDAVKKHLQNSLNNWREDNINFLCLDCVRRGRGIVFKQGECRVKH